jgi:hypothetical protein
LLPGSGFAGDVVVEVGTRKHTDSQRAEDLRESLDFARAHLGE